MQIAFGRVRRKTSPTNFKGKSASFKGKSAREREPNALPLEKMLLTPDSGHAII